MNTEAASPPAIDMTAITQLAEGGELGEQFIVEIIDVFLGDLSKRVHVIGTQTSNRDFAGIKATAHAIKGSCGHFGAMRLIDLLLTIEELAGRAETDGLQNAIDSMVAETVRVRAALELFRARNARP